MQPRFVHAADAPDTTGINIGNFSRAARVGDTVYIGDAGAELGDIVMLTALLTSLDDLDTLNEVQAEFFPAPHPPRSTLQVAGLPHGRVELTAVAVIGSGSR